MRAPAPRRHRSAGDPSAISSRHSWTITPGTPIRRKHPSTRSSITPARTRRRRSTGTFARRGRRSWWRHALPHGGSDDGGAALLPLIAQIGQRDGGPVVAVLENFGILEPVSVTIALALAAGALVVDRVWGASIGCDPGRIFLLRRGAASRLAGRPWRGACLTVVLQGEHSGGASPLHNGR